MTQDEIIEMAKQAGMLQINGAYNIWIPEYIEDFAKLVAVRARKEMADEFAGLGEWGCVHIIEAIDS